MTRTQRSILFILSVALPMGLRHLIRRPGHGVPHWIILVSMIPLALFSISGARQEGKVRDGIAMIYLLGASVLLMFIGVLGIVVKGSFLSMMTPALPFGAIAFIVAAMVIYFRSR